MLSSAAEAPLRATAKMPSAVILQTALLALRVGEEPLGLSCCQRSSWEGNFTSSQSVAQPFP